MPTDDNDLPASPDASRANLPDHARRMQDLLGGLSNVAATIADAGGVAGQYPFIGINNSGVWAFGQDRTEVEAGSLWAVDVRSWKHGYIAWPDEKAKERKPLGERMVPANAPLPKLSDLPEVGAPYQVQFSFEMLCMSGADTGTVALWKNGSHGAKVLVQTLVEEVRKQARINPDRLCPVGELLIRTYFHQQWKKDIHNPVFAIRKWIPFADYDGFDKPSEAAPEPQSPASPPAAAGTGRKPAPAAEAPAAAAAGVGRRRPRERTQPAA